jgi:hypothetical protein
MKYTIDYSYMNPTYNLLKSRTFWTLVIMSLLPIANVIVPTLPGGVQAGAELVLGILAAYFHNSTAVNAGATN